MGKSTISMAIFNCYVSSPEGIPIINCFLLWFWQEMRRLPTAITSQFHCRWPSAVLQSVAEEQQRIQQAEEQQGWVNRANGSKDYQSWSRYSIYIQYIYIDEWIILWLSCEHFWKTIFNMMWNPFIVPSWTMDHIDHPFIKFIIFFFIHTFMKIYSWKHTHCHPQTWYIMIHPLPSGKLPHSYWKWP